MCKCKTNQRRYQVQPGESKYKTKVLTDLFNKGILMEMLYTDTIINITEEITFVNFPPYFYEMETGIQNAVINNFRELLSKSV